MAFRPVSIKVRALQWLSQREHSRTELRLKLMRLLSASKAAAAQNRGTDAADEPSAEAEVVQLLDWLTSHGYLSAERFVESRVHARQTRFGNRRIDQELQRHGLALAPEARQALQATELERAREVWRKKYGQTAIDAAGRARQGRFLVGRGFTADVVRRVVQGLSDDSSA